MDNNLKERNKNNVNKKPIKINKDIKLKILVLCDIISLFGVAILSMIISFRDIRAEWVLYLIITLFNGLILGSLFIMFRLYSAILKYEGFDELFHLILSISLMLLLDLFLKIFLGDSFSFRWATVNALLLLMATSLSRFSYKVVIHIKNRRFIYFDDRSRTRVMIVGAGDCGTSLAREMQVTDKINMTPVCFVDDNEDKIGSSICGILVAGNTNKVVELAKEFEVELIVLAMPSIPKKRTSEILKICSQTKCPIKIIPGMYQFITGQAALSDMRDVDVKDLLGREQVETNLSEVMGYIENRVVLVTGGGGSIGSELCTQIASHNPKQLIIFDIYENNAYAIQMDLIRKYKDQLNLTVLIGNIRDKGKVEDLFSKYKPEIVFHAAAHKHVPLMEVSPCEAIKNNVMGTYNLINAADKYNVKRFIQISTDKAVNPTSLMGATKRICEMMIQTMGKRSKTEFVAVRFGNVLGSNGSVIPLFKQQIKEGGPVTITHKDIIRYFMTIPEAVSLVLQAGAYAKGGEIYVLNMGEPVRIYDMAVNLIMMSGYEPGKDIEIKIVGLRPGEKLYEERLMDEEGMQTTPNNMINIGKPIEIDEENLWKQVEMLGEYAYKEVDATKMKTLVTKLVPTYHITDN